MDESFLFRFANICLALVHCIYVIVFAWGLHGRSIKHSFVAKLCFPMILFFASGVIAHSALALSDTDQFGWMFVARLFVVAACLPFVGMAITALRHLPTKEVYEATLRQMLDEQRLAKERAQAEISRVDDLLEDINSLRLDVNDYKERQEFRWRINLLSDKLSSVRTELLEDVRHGKNNH